MNSAANPGAKLSFTAKYPWLMLSLFLAGCAGQGGGDDSTCGGSPLPADNIPSDAKPSDCGTTLCGEFHEYECVDGAWSRSEAYDCRCAGVCTLSLEQCGDQCPLTEQAARDEATLACAGAPPSWRSVAGRCGDFRYVEQNDGLSGVIYYFDAQASLVGGTITAAIPIYCDKTSSELTFGLAPDCTPLQDADLCL